MNHTDPAVAPILDAAVALFCDVLGPQCDILLHGSLAMDCFHPDTSDVDLLVITPSAPTLAQKRALRAGLMELSCNPFPLEIHVLPEMTQFVHPAPFYFHYSEAWRDRDEKAALFEGENTDPDLAAHFVICRWYGCSLHGRDPLAVLPKVPHAAYWDSIHADIASVSPENPVYAVCSIGRTLGYIKNQLILSKRGGCVYGLGHAPDDFKPLFQKALDAYSTGGSISEEGLAELIDYMNSETAHFMPFEGFAE